MTNLSPFAGFTVSFMEEVNIMKKYSRLEKSLTIFLGHAKKKGATKEELDNIVKTIDLVRKYLPFYQKKEA